MRNIEGKLAAAKNILQNPAQRVIGIYPGSARDPRDLAMASRNRELFCQFVRELFPRTHNESSFRRDAETIHARRVRYPERNPLATVWRITNVLADV